MQITTIKLVQSGNTDWNYIRGRNMKTKLFWQTEEEEVLRN